MDFKLHTPDTAPEGAKKVLSQAKEAFGFVPNLLAIMGEAPALAKGYLALTEAFNETSFSPAERQLILLAASRENGCTYCVAAYSVMAEAENVSDEIIERFRDDKPVEDQKLEALRTFAKAVVKSRGWPSEKDTKAFFGAGYGKQQLLEVILGVGLKTLSNYTNHIADTPLDKPFQKAAWKQKS